MIKLSTVALCVVLGAAIGTPALAADDGAALYSTDCASCHGADGKAETPVAKAMNVPELAGTSLSAEAIAKFVMENAKHKSQANKLTPENLAEIGSFIVGGFK